MTMVEPARRQTPVPVRMPRANDIRWTMAGFGPMARISTSFGEVHAQALRVGDMVRTPEGEMKRIIFIDRFKLDAGFLDDVPDAHPVCIMKGALGTNLPRTDCVVSPRQLMGVGRQSVDLDYREAADLLGQPAVYRKEETLFTYTRFHCGEPVLARVEGVWTRIEP